ncbi:P-type H+-ATPase [Strigomonas culicis]|uniref:P-type H(+)-exporting transporter n=1 Tax=Strigomonas culicis TaxID=28005 RepID=S9VID6_9TRYP|nr:P-type H+-ATPase [Strigomonas culicis]|eukprot:EPY22980.1 P-type H+-ATPase [Strigomonas culicis]
MALPSVALARQECSLSPFVTAVSLFLRLSLFLCLVLENIFSFFFREEKKTNTDTTDIFRQMLKGDKESSAFEDRPKSHASEELPAGKPQRRQSVLSKAISEHNEDATGPANDLLPPSKGLTTAEAEELLAKYGYNELPEKKTPSWVIYVRGLWGPMPAALWVAIVIEFALENWPDGAILFAIQIANATIGWFETMKAGDAVAALKNSLKPMATVHRDGKWQTIDGRVLVPGDLVKLASGSAVPADCSINEGIIDVDESALTGESLPATMGPENMPKMGSNVVRGEVDGTVQFTGAQTFFGKTAALLQSVESDLGNIHVILGRVMISLCAISFVLCMCCFIYLLAMFYETFRRSLQFAVVVLVVSIPIALEIVVTTTLAVGSTHLSKHKIIVTKLSAIEMMSGVNMLCSDKTGTLTLNKMEIQEQCFTFEEGNDLHSSLVLAALAAKWREPPRDALDTMVLGAADLDECDNYVQLDFTPFDPTTKRTAATLRDKRTNEQFKVTKGAPHIVLQMVHNQDEINDEVVDIIDTLASRGVRCLSVARTDSSNRWHMAGILTFLDPPRPGYERDHSPQQALRRGCEDDHRRPLADCQGDVPHAEPGPQHSDRGQAAEDQGCERPTRRSRREVRRHDAERGRLRPGVPGAQVHDRGDPAPARLHVRDDGRWCERRARAEACRCRYCRARRDGCGACGRRYGADGARSERRGGGHAGVPRGVPAHALLPDVPYFCHPAAGRVLLHCVLLSDAPRLRQR